MRAILAAMASLTILLVAFGPARANDEFVGPVIPDVLPCRTAHSASDFLPEYHGNEWEIPPTIRCVLRVGRTSPEYLVTFSNLVKRSTGEVLERWHWNVTAAPRDDPTKTQVLPDAEFPGEGGCGIEVGDFNFDGF